MIKIEKVPVTTELKVIYCDICTNKLGELQDYNRSHEATSPKCARIYSPNDTTSDDVKTLCEKCWDAKIAPLFPTVSAGN